MSESWATVVALAAATILIRASGPVALGGRELPQALTGVVALIAPALLAALVVTQTLSDASGELAIEERAAGVAAAGAVLALRGSLLPAIAVAAAVTAGLRALG